MDGDEGADWDEGEDGANIKNANMEKMVMKELTKMKARTEQRRRW